MQWVVNMQGLHCTSVYTGQHTDKMQYSATRVFFRHIVYKW